MLRGINILKFNLILYNLIYRVVGNNVSFKQWNFGIFILYFEEFCIFDRYYLDSGL